MTVLYRSDSLQALRTFPSNKYDAIVTDPPYGLSSVPDAAEVLSRWLAWDDYDHKGKGFYGEDWDSFVPGPQLWAECLRVLKPGGHLLCFAGSRTVDLMGIAIRLGGFEIRDQIQWIYSSGMPKSLDISKAFDRSSGDLPPESRGFTVAGHKRDGKISGVVPSAGYKRPDPVTDNAKKWLGWGTGMKPAHEPIIVARKPLDGTVANNVEKFGTGGFNIDASRIGVGDGRWPSNIVLGHHQSCVEVGIKESKYGGGAKASVTGNAKVEFVGGYKKGDGLVGKMSKTKIYECHPDCVVEGMSVQANGDVGKFFYCSKASRAERQTGMPDGGRNIHTTVKPVALMEYLVRLVTPPSGIVLDPFCGSGTTLVAAVNLGFNCDGIDNEAKYLSIAKSRIDHASGDAKVMRRRTQ